MSYVLPPKLNENRQTDLLKKQNNDDVGETKEVGNNTAKGGNKGHGRHREEDGEEEKEEDEEEEGEEDEEGEEEEGEGDTDREDDENTVQFSGGLSFVNDLRNIMNFWEKELNGAKEQVGTMRKQLERLERTTTESEWSFFFYKIVGKALSREI